MQSRIRCNIRAVRIEFSFDCAARTPAAPNVTSLFIIIYWPPEDNIFICRGASFRKWPPYIPLVVLMTAAKFANSRRDTVSLTACWCKYARETQKNIRDGVCAWWCRPGLINFMSTGMVITPPGNFAGAVATDILTKFRISFSGMYKLISEHDV